jgi:hypothetical protein
MSINDGGPAFPSTIQYFPDDKNANEEQGMTLRDWFAQTPPHGAQNITRYEARYIHADQMLKAREVKP